MVEIMGIPISHEMVGEWLFKYGLNVLGALAILGLGWAGAGLVRKFARDLMKRAHFEQILVSFLSNILYALVLAFVIIAALNQLGMQTASLIAVIGAAGLAVGLALQGSLSNFAAGIMIILFKHFKIGDFIQGGGVTGTVVDMNIFTTTLNTATNERVMVPNSTLTGGPLINFTGNDIRRIDLIIGIGYGDDLSKAQEVLQRVIAANKRTLKTPASFVGVDALADSSVNFAVRAWVKRADFGDVRSELLRAIKEELDGAGISIPYPQRDVHMVTPPSQEDGKKKKTAAA